MVVNMRLASLALSLFTLCLWPVSACGDGRSSLQIEPAPQPALRVIALTDLSGYLEPCGCQSRPLGGIDRAASKLQSLRADRIPTLFFAVGDVLFGPRPEGATSDADAAAQETWKAETLVDIFSRLGMSAATPGSRDLSYGSELWTQLQTRSKFAWLPSQPDKPNEPNKPGHDNTDPSAAVASQLTRVGALDVGLLGVSTFEGPDADITSDRIRALSEQMQAQIDQLRTQNARVVIALFSGDQRSGRRLLSGLRGLDFVVQGGTDDASAKAPSTIGGSTQLRAGRQGQGLLVVDIYLNGSEPFVDASDWTRKEQKSALSARIQDLEQRVSAWQRDPSVDRKSLEEQRSKLRELRKEQQRSESKPSLRGNAFNARYEPITHEVPSDAQIAGIVDAYNARVNEHNRVAFADKLPTPAPPGSPFYVGSSTCQSCHAPAYTWWTQHAHGHAYTTLERVHKQFNLSCVGCHVTGYAQPGGSTVVHNEGLTHVGCESCHGPGSLHARDPSAAKLTRSPAEGVCKTCHTPEHSDLFEFSSYAQRLRAKGHGLPFE